MPENEEPTEQTEDEGKQEPAAEPEAAEPDPEDEEGGRWRFRKFARKILDRPLAEDTRDLLYAVLNTSDKAKTEMIRMVAREVRNYLDELKLKDDLIDLMRNHSLEISISLKPIAHELAKKRDEAAD